MGADVVITVININLYLINIAKNNYGYILQNNK